jgi:hypothetical protein
LKNREFDKGGWQGDLPTELGSNGGPLWIERDGRPTVVGVVSAFSILRKPTQELTNYLYSPPTLQSALFPKPELATGSAGARITNDACYKMIAHHIGGHPEPPKETDYKLIFMAYPPGTPLDDGTTSVPGHIFVEFKKNGLRDKVMGFGPEGKTYLPNPGGLHDDSKLADSELVGRNLNKFPVKVGAKGYKAAMAVDASYYTIGINDCVTYAAAVAKAAGLNCPEFFDGVVTPIGYVDALKARNEAAPEEMGK